MRDDQYVHQKPVVSPFVQGFTFGTLWGMVLMACIWWLFG